MRGLMQDWDLTLNKIIDHARDWHGDRVVVSRISERRIVRSTHAQIHARAKRLSNALNRAG